MTPYAGCVTGPNLRIGQGPFMPGWERAAIVEACRHEVWEHVLVQPDASGARNEICVRCKVCNAPRCGDSDDPDPCMRVRHHGDTIVIRSRKADLVFELTHEAHYIYSEWLAAQMPSSLEREDLERWLTE